MFTPTPKIFWCGGLDGLCPMEKILEHDLKNK